MVSTQRGTQKLVPMLSGDEFQRPTTRNICRTFPSSKDMAVDGIIIFIMIDKTRNSIDITLRITILFYVKQTF